MAVKIFHQNKIGENILAQQAGQSQHASSSGDHEYLDLISWNPTENVFPHISKLGSKNLTEHRWVIQSHIVQG